MVLKNEQQRIKALLTEAITVLCKNGLGYHYNFTIEGLLGITLDDADDIFLVNIKETITKAERPPPEEVHSPPPEVRVRSPSGNSRRRRRRSNDNNPDSPPKRPAYGSDVPQEDPSDVIVIKEEVTDSEVAAEFYGDSGGGLDQMQQEGQYMQGDPGTPGCSQWDQGQAMSWPSSASQSFANSPIQQSPAMSSASQVTNMPESSLPASCLRSPAIKQILSADLVTPVLAHGWKVCAFRMTWSGRDNASVDVVRARLVELREELDKMVQTLPGVLFFVSAITATTSRERIEGMTNYFVHPAVGYWVVYAPSVGMDQKDLFCTMQENRLSATLKLLLQPYQHDARHIINSLHLILKNTMDGCVPRMVQASALQCLGQAGANYPLMKIYVLDETQVKFLNPVQAALKQNGLNVDIVVPP